VGADLRRACGGRDQRGEHAHGCRPARAVGPEHRDELAGRDVEIEAPHCVHGGVAAGEILGQSPGADHDDHARSLSGHFLSAMNLLPPCGRRWLTDRTDGTLVTVTAKLPALMLVGRRHVDLRRVSSALCR